MIPRKHMAPFVLILAVAGIGTALASWKHNVLEDQQAAAMQQPEPVEAVAVATAEERQHFRSTTSVGTVVATRSISVRNELSGTVRSAALTPGQIVEPGTVLVALDVSVEEAELKALEAQAQLAQTQYERVQRMNAQRAAADMELDSARAERDVMLAQMARLRAVIERKTIRAPFRARVGLSDVHPGQYLNAGTLLTTLQGVDEHVYVDFTVAQQVLGGLAAGDEVQVLTGRDAAPVTAEIIAIDSRVDPATRNALVRARISSQQGAVTPGASVRVHVPTEEPRLAVVIPANALRKGPGGDHVFIVEQNEQGQARAQLRTVEVETLAGDEVVIRNGLKAGERVAASGSFKLRDQVLVAVLEQGPAVAQKPAPALEVSG